MCITGWLTIALASRVWTCHIGCPPKEPTLNHPEGFDAQAAHPEAAPAPADLRAVLKPLEGLRDYVKGLMLANVKSWESGNAETTR